MGPVMKEKIVKFEKGKEGIALPEEYLRFLELIPGAEVEVKLDKKRKWIVIRPMHGEDFLEHFRDTMESMA
jgi:antitoxin component of MazEF toxin-antitoxin module